MGQTGGVTTAGRQAAPSPTRLRLVLAAVLAGAVLAVPPFLAQGHGPAPDPVRARAQVVTAGAPPTTAARVDPLAAGRALAALPATGKGVFDSATGDFASHFDDVGDSDQTQGGARPRVVAGPAMRFALPGGGRRSEVLPRTPEYREGDDVWVHDVSALHGLPTGTSTWQLILQWHQRANSGSPPVALEAGGGRLRLANVGGDQQDLGPLRPDDRLDVVLHVHFSRSAAKAVIDVWRDGKAVLRDYHPPRGTLLDGADYLKLGLYRDPSIAQDSAMTTTRLVAGPTAESINVQGITPGR
ncbi:heparin lyase I family protein [Actinomycetospora termitidis]|uniref:Heparin lyase I family protein n=1 Tax=Actinomycetospora termitidis TaxID=3053470 RepID=A0ABT7MI11_9PSEU|nr:heparin lyase I family protein [Actinomycetospora sp. Odt1-22]MDL5160328.1 heparin lyase I family protein [Actinomycetospora sp. Odt1-22]